MCAQTCNDSINNNRIQNFPIQNKWYGAQSAVWTFSKLNVQSIESFTYDFLFVRVFFRFIFYFRALYFLLLWKLKRESVRKRSIDWVEKAFSFNKTVENKIQNNENTVWCCLTIGIIADYIVCFSCDTMYNSVNAIQFLSVFFVTVSSSLVVVLRFSLNSS